MVSKILAEEAAWRFAEENSIDLVILNPGLVIGPLIQPTPTFSRGIFEAPKWYSFASNEFYINFKYSSLCFFSNPKCSTILAYRNILLPQATLFRMILMILLINLFSFFLSFFSP